MTFEIFLVLLSICSVVTSLTTQFVKKFLQDIASNIIVLVTGIIVALAVAAVYAVFKDLPVTTSNIIYCILLCIGSGFGAILGYKTIKDTANQIHEMTKEIK